MFFIVRSNDSFNFPLGWIKYIVIVVTNAIWQQAAHTTYQLSSPSCSTRAIQKSLTFNKKYLSFQEKIVRRLDHYQKNDKTEKARGLGRNNKRDMKGESNDSPEIPDRRVTSDIPGHLLQVQHGMVWSNRNANESIQYMKLIVKSSVFPRLWFLFTLVLYM